MLFLNSTFIIKSADQSEWNKNSRNDVKLYFYWRTSDGLCSQPLIGRCSRSNFHWSRFQTSRFPARWSPLWCVCCGNTTQHNVSCLTALFPHHNLKLSSFIPNINKISNIRNKEIKPFLHHEIFNSIISLCGLGSWTHGKNRWKQFLEWGKSAPCWTWFLNDSNIKFCNISLTLLTVNKPTSFWLIFPQCTIKYVEISFQNIQSPVWLVFPGLDKKIYDLGKKQVCRFFQMNLNLYFV